MDRRLLSFTEALRIGSDHGEDEITVSYPTSTTAILYDDADDGALTPGSLASEFQKTFDWDKAPRVAIRNQNQFASKDNPRYPITRTDADAGVNGPASRGSHNGKAVLRTSDAGSAQSHCIRWRLICCLVPILILLASGVALLFVLGVPALARLAVERSVLVLDGATATSLTDTSFKLFLGFNISSIPLFPNVVTFLEPVKVVLNRNVMLFSLPFEDRQTIIDGNGKGETEIDNTTISVADPAGLQMFLALLGRSHNMSLDFMGTVLVDAFSQRHYVDFIKTVTFTGLQGKNMVNVTTLNMSQNTVADNSIAIFTTARIWNPIDITLQLDQINVTLSTTSMDPVASLTSKFPVTLLSNESANIALQGNLLENTANSLSRQVNDFLLGKETSFRAQITALTPNLYIDALLSNATINVVVPGMNSVLIQSINTPGCTLSLPSNSMLDSSTIVNQVNVSLPETSVVLSFGIAYQVVSLSSTSMEIGFQNGASFGRILMPAASVNSSKAMGQSSMLIPGTTQQMIITSQAQFKSFLTLVSKQNVSMRVQGVTNVAAEVAIGILDLRQLPFSYNITLQPPRISASLEELVVAARVQSSVVVTGRLLVTQDSNFQLSFSLVSFDIVLNQTRIGVFNSALPATGSQNVSGQGLVTNQQIVRLLNDGQSLNVSLALNNPSLVINNVRLRAA
ncbi:hypothetical protein SeLEV6574_g08059, partial [Synchytrium endobioticum]